MTTIAEYITQNQATISTVYFQDENAASLVDENGTQIFYIDGNYGELRNVTVNTTVEDAKAEVLMDAPASPSSVAAAANAIP